MRRRLPLAVLLVVGLRSAGALYMTRDLREMVQRATLIVRAKLMRTEEAERHGHDQGPDYPDTAVFAVQKILFGRCARTIRMQYGSGWALWEGLVGGGVYYLCLSPSDDRPGVYREANDGLTPMLARGNRVKLKGIRVPKSAKPRLRRPTPETLERVIGWLRGPTLTVKPVKPAFRCDESLLFDVTLANRSALHMELPVGADTVAFNEHFRGSLWDAQGFPLLIDCSCKLHPFEPGDWAQAEATRRLAPGRTVAGRVRLDILLSDYAQDPANADTLRLAYKPFVREKKVHGPVWTGVSTVNVPIRVTCPYAKWAATLSRHNGELLVTLGNGECTKRERLVALPATGVPVAFAVERPTRDVARYTLDEPAELEPDLERCAAACFRVERNGRRLPGPRAEDAAARRFAERAAARGQFPLAVDLARYYAFDTAGTYRVRLVLPGARRPSLSNILEVVVPATDGP